MVVEFDTSEPPSFSVIHYPDVQNLDGSFDVRFSYPRLTKANVSEHYVVGFYSHYFNTNAAPSVMASGHP